jgi:hypothetical protein
VSAAEGFLWWDGGGGEGISGSRDAAWRVAARGLDASGLARLRVTVKEARTALTGALEVIWEPTGRAWTGCADGRAGVAWTASVPSQNRSPENG